MNDTTTPLPKHAATPELMANRLRNFAEGAEVLVGQMQAGQAEDAAKDDQAAAEKAALSLLRNSAEAVRMIRRLETYAEGITNSAAQRRTELMTSMFGPDDADE